MLANSPQPAPPLETSRCQHGAPYSPPPPPPSQDPQSATPTPKCPLAPILGLVQTTGLRPWAHLLPVPQVLTDGSIIHHLHGPSQSPGAVLLAVSLHTWCTGTSHELSSAPSNACPLLPIFPGQPPASLYGLRPPAATQAPCSLLPAGLPSDSPPAIPCTLPRAPIPTHPAPVVLLPGVPPEGTLSCTWSGTSLELAEATSCHGPLHLEQGLRPHLSPVSASSLSHIARDSSQRIFHERDPERSQQPMPAPGGFRGPSLRAPLFSSTGPSLSSGHELPAFCLLCQPLLSLAPPVPPSTPWTA